MHRIGVAEKVVHVAQNLLVCTHKEHAKVVWLCRLQLVYLQRVGLGVVVDEVSNLAVTVAGHVLDGATAVGTLIEPVYWHDGEELVDTPAVGQALEKREVTEVLVGKQFRELAEVIGYMLHVLRNGKNLANDTPEHALNLCAGLEVYNAMAEEFKCLLTNLLCVVQRLEHRTLVELAPYLVEFLCQVVVVCRNLPLLIHLWQCRRLKNLEHQYGMVCRYRASALGNDVRMRDAVLVGRVDHGVDGVVHILLD